MGTIVCQHCNSTVSHFEDEKVTVLYGKCEDSHDQCVETHVDEL
ncbi:GapA-binding peptide SR1P [Bacillus carboniphilus]|uniref:GapA-binding peptide SR1P n=1 Tax=Bacillus carboniphilus TaxID=86663 RepID=A0ABY9JV65_9BACI|nr:GapA-binding peptide SR1P [Bacillus carboniphilus]WLR43297.1 GapA-binding peptide SR1P [Bacillus carboniphilus]